MGKVFCDLCSLSCTSVRSLCEHVVGVKHKALLARFAPAKLRELGRVQYFLDTYLKEEPILGLEYVVERQVDSSYLYTCLLCNVEYEWRKMVAHVTDVEHAESYIYKHHSDMTSVSSYVTREEQVSALEEAAQAIYAKFGRKEIRVHKPGADSLTAIGTAPCAAGDDLLKEGAKERLSDQMLACRKDSDTSYSQNYDCSLCSVKCDSPVALCEHIQGNKHKRNLQRTGPRQLRELGRLSYFLHTHLNEDPILGLEYIVEAGPGPLYNYSCQLCNLDTDLLKIVVHLTDIDHMDRYIKKHHGDLLPSVPRFTKKTVYLKTLKEVAVKIVGTHGRKEIQLKNATAGSPTKVKAFTEDDSETNSFHPRKRPLPYQETEFDESHECYSYQKMLKKF